jgi:hypothetical protein
MNGLVCITVIISSNAKDHVILFEQIRPIIIRSLFQLTMQMISYHREPVPELHRRPKPRL